ncbi:uncharacterized protein LOC108473498 isoform X2 [Gossypium arboreum]|uniref:uncharacterized protein LOC108473498 isoform X2 n=1 Tax=Gossypium arboreum TaxID=29729 RepID=UPI0008195319|nr:uncharacterized protein LOC108473498 isoform X2 [Gossypium arboreum]
MNYKIWENKAITLGKCLTVFISVKHFQEKKQHDLSFLFAFPFPFPHPFWEEFALIRDKFPKFLIKIENFQSSSLLIFLIPNLSQKVNAEKVAVFGKKMTQKLYRRHSGRPGGMKVETFNQLQQRIPERIIEHTIRGSFLKEEHCLTT